jgi:hypothetical protein
MTTLRSPILVFIISLVVHGAVAPSAMAAEDPTEALLRRGAELRKQDRHEEALDLFRKAHALSPSGRTLAQMGLAEFSLKSYVDAETHLVTALASDSPWIAKNRAVLEQALGDVRKHVAIVTVAGPAGTDVAVNGRSVGRLPLSEPLHIAEGQVRIEGTAPDRQPATLDVTLAGGKEFKASLDLAPVPASVPALAPTGAAAAPSGPALSGGATADTGRRWQPWVGGGLLALSAAALTTGIVWVSIDGNQNCDIPSTAPTGSRCARVYDTKTLGWIAIGAGAAAGVAGGILIWKGRAGDVQLGMGPGTLTAFGRF